MKDFLHAFRLFIPVGLILLASGLSLVAQSTQVQWKESSVSFDESAGIISLTIVRSGDMFGSKTVSYSTVEVPNSATSGLDYFAATGLTKILPNGVEEVEVQITINQDPFEEGNESFLVRLSTFDPTVTVGGTSDLTVTINDDDGSTGSGSVVVEWVDSIVRVKEDASTVLLNAVRTGGLSSAVSVSYETSFELGSGISSADFQGGTGTINFPANVSDQQVSITITNDVFTESDEEFKVTLKNVSSGNIGTRNPVRVIIEDDESAPGVIGWNVASAQVSEGDGEIQLEVRRIGGTQGALSVNYTSSSSTAIAGSDFTTVSDTLNWTSGSNTSRFVTVPILDDGDQEDIESFDIVLSSNGGDVQIEPSTITISIEDNDNSTNAGTASFVEQSVSVDESIGSLSIAVARAGGSSEVLTVGYTFVDSSTTKGVDYIGVDGTLTWLAGDTTNKVIQIPIIDDGRADSGEIFYVSLTATDAALLGSQTTFTVVLEDNDIDTPGTVTFATASQTILENLGQASVLVQRIGGSVGEVSVSYETAPGTALENLDFLVSSGTLIWADGDSIDKEVLVPLVNDNFFEGNETLSISLSDVAGGNVAGANSVHSITIQDDEPEPATWFEFKRSLYSGTESAGQVQIEVERFGSGVGTASVSIQSANNTAFVGLDFVPLNEQLSWLDGETGIKVVSLILVDDQIDEATEEVTLVLADPSENALLGDLSDASALIYDDDGITGELVNLSTRGYVGNGNEVLVGGFIIFNAPQQILIRAVGPSLTGVDGVVSDPSLQIIDNADQTVLAENDNWTDDTSQIQPILDTGLGGLNLFESAILVTLPAGSYSAVVSSNGDPGIASVEIYVDSSAGLSGDLVNISTRGHVSTGDQILIGGIIIGGNASKRLLFRGMGPSLIIPGSPSLSNPELLVFNSAGQIIYSNDDWLNAPNWDEIEATQLIPMDQEAAMLLDLDPGSYTIHLRSEQGGSGIGLVEIYSLN